MDSNYPEDFIRAHPPNRTGAVLIDLFAIGTPGTVGMVISSVGPVELTDEEMLQTLKSAQEQIEEKIHATR